MIRLFRAAIGILTLFAPGVAVAAVDPCTFLGGNCGMQNVPLNAVVPLATFMVVIAAGASVVFVMVGAMLMALNMGDESKIARGRTAILYALGGLALTFLAQTIVSFITIYFGGVSAADPAVSLMSMAVSAMKSLFTITFVIMMIFGGFWMVYARGKTDEFNKAKIMVIWCCIAAIVVNVAHALVQAVLNLF
ncbi:hypothetical protein COU80_03165 [Candidatus Peregrinibacteria bacterium CG10_big_fil_rev_8_21_14_0_10_55_24]|nr:MAG: hypothetical protein COU80_03165 [Candidatus Peregrinibacteria bacterium CG10_big_fil_rev_8_21_14_0_10_55_24]